MPTLKTLVASVGAVAILAVVAGHVALAQNNADTIVTNGKIVRLHWATAALSAVMLTWPDARCRVAPYRNDASGGSQRRRLSCSAGCAAAAADRRGIRREAHVVLPTSESCAGSTSTAFQLT